MGQINKGTIAGIEGNTARVVPSDAGAKPTAKIVIPWHLRGDTGKLQKGTAVVYVVFDDSTGLLLGRRSRTRRRRDGRRHKPEKAHPHRRAWRNQRAELKGGITWRQWQNGARKHGP